MAVQKDLQNYDKVLVVVECVVFGIFNSEVKTLLVQRSTSPEWNVMSDILKDETVEETAHRTLTQIPGVEATHVEHLRVYSDFNRRGEKRVLVVTVCAIIRSDAEAIPSYPGYRWFSFYQLPPMTERVLTIFLEAKKKLKEIAYVFCTMAPLLPQKFTLTQLQRIYESIHEMRIDKANLSKRFFAADVLRRLEEKNPTTSKKGSFYYEFDQRVYPRMFSLRAS